MKKNYNDAVLNRNTLKNRKRERRIHYAIIGLLIFICIGLTGIIMGDKIKLMSLKHTNNNLEKEIARLEIELQNTKNEYEVLENISNYKTEVITALQETNEELDSQLLNIAEKNDELHEIIYDKDDTIKELEDKVNTYEDYEYALYYGNERNDLTYEQLQLGEDLMVAKGYDPDLLFGIIMVESGGREDVVNVASGATGYGQFLRVTGRYIYEDVLNAGTYNHNVTPKDGDNNIKMMAAYIDLLYNKYDGDIVLSMKEYCGSSSYTTTYNYMNKVNNKLTSTGKNIYNMSVNN